MKRSIHCVQSVQRREKMGDAFALRKQGYSITDIAAQLGLKPDYCRGLLRDCCAMWLKNHSEDVAHYAALDLSRLDDYLLALAPAIEQGSTEAIRVALEIVKIRGRWLGTSLLQGATNSGNEVKPELMEIISRASMLLNKEASAVGAN